MEMTNKSPGSHAEKNTQEGQEEYIERSNMGITPAQQTDEFDQFTEYSETMSDIFSVADTEPSISSVGSVVSNRIVADYVAAKLIACADLRGLLEKHFLSLQTKDSHDRLLKVLKRYTQDLQYFATKTQEKIVADFIRSNYRLVARAIGEGLKPSAAGSLALKHVGETTKRELIARYPASAADQHVQDGGEQAESGAEFDADSNVSEPPEDYPPELSLQRLNEVEIFLITGVPYENLIRNAQLKLVSNSGQESPLATGSGLDNIRGSLLQQFQQPQAATGAQPQEVCVKIVAQWEIPSLLKDNFPQGTALSSVFTLSGAEDKAQATTCGEYIAWRWPRIGPHFLERLSKAIARIISDSVDTEIDSASDYEETPVSLSAMELTQRSCQVGVSGDYNAVFDVVEAIAWICATIRDSPVEELSYSDVRWIIRASSDTSGDIQPIFKLRLSHLEPIEPVNNTTCWHYLFTHTVIARTHNIPNREDGGRGLEIAFELMADLASIEHCVVYKGGLVLVGYSTLLLPLNEHIGFSVQWHLDVCEDRRICLTNADRFLTSKLLRLVDKGLEELKELAASRTFLGWCPSVKVTLGTNHHSTSDVTWSHAKPVGHTLERENVNVGAQLAISAISFVKASFTGSFQARFKNNSRRFTKERSYRTILSQASEPVIVYDTSSRQAWLVPELSLVLHMLHRHESTWPGNTAFPVALAESHGGLAAKDAIERALEEHGNFVIDNCEYDSDSKPFLFTDLLIKRTVALGIALTPTEEDKSIDVKAQPNNELRGFEFMEIGGPDSLRQMKTWKLANTAGLWTQFLRSNPSWVKPVVFCANLGPAVIASTPTGSTVKGCSTIPKGRDYLISTVDSLQQLVKRVHGCLQSEMVAGLHWHCPNERGPFLSCLNHSTCRGSWEEYHLQRLKKGGKAKNIRPPKSICEDGAIAFGEDAGKPHRWVR